ncbi:MAG TPA: hypothetical protein VMZ69_02250, partial [Saprospiraceae bacterium]|nr:hypothetical protein [Saprospiraceae bacterium]
MAKSKKQPVKSSKTKPLKKKKGISRLTGQDWKYIGICLGITLLAFISVFGHDWVNWDDDFNVRNNTNTALLNWDNIVNIFSDHVIGNYNP